MAQEVSGRGVSPSYDQDYWNWRKLVDWELSAVPGKPGLCQYPDVRIRALFEDCLTPAQASASLTKAA